MKSRTLFILFLIVVLMCGSASAATLAGPDPCNSLTNWTGFYGTPATIENGSIRLGPAVGDGVGWTDDIFSGNRTVSFTYVDFDTGEDEYFQVNLNGTLVDGDYATGWRVRLYETGTHLLCDPTGSYQTFETSQTINNGDTVNISTNGTHVCVLINDNSAGILEGGNESGHVEFRTVSAVLGQHVGFDNFTVTDELQMTVAGDTPADDTPADDTPGNIYYVKTTGSDSNDGLSYANAWKTPNGALSNATINSIIYFDTGTYDFTDFDVPANNLTLDNYGTGDVVFRGYPQDENYGNVTITGSGWGINNVKLTVNNITMTQFAEGIISLRSNSSFTNVEMYNGSGRIGGSGAQPMIGLGATSNTAMQNQSIINCNIYDYCMPTPFDVYGSISPNIVGINGDKDTSEISGNTLIKDSWFHGQALHAVINMQTQSYNEKYGSGLNDPKLQYVTIDGCTFGPFENRFSNPSTSLAVIVANQGPMQYLTVRDSTFDTVPGTTTKAIVGLYWDSTFDNITFDNIDGHAMMFEKLTDDVAGVTLYPQNITVNNIVELNDSLYGVTMPGGTNYTWNDSAIHRYDFNGEVTDVTISNQKYVGSVELSFTDAGAGDKEVIVVHENGRLFTETHPNDIIANSTGTYLDFSTNTANTDYYINNIGYSLEPTTTATVNNVSIGGCNVTLTSAETVTFTELSTSETADVELESGTTYVAFDSLVFETQNNSVSQTWTLTVTEAAGGSDETTSNQNADIWIKNISILSIVTLIMIIAIPLSAMVAIRRNGELPEGSMNKITVAMIMIMILAFIISVGTKVMELVSGVFK